MDRGTIALVLVVVAALAASHGGAYFLGRANQATEAALEQADLNADASDANAATSHAVNEAGGRQANNSARYTQDAANARRTLESYDAPPPAGYVGGDALVDPAIAGPLLDCVDGLRRDAEAGSC